MLNQLLGGHYRVIKKLGQGGLAQTYIVEDHHRPGYPKCTAKFLKPVDKDPTFLPTARRLFLQEAEILEKLGQHEQIPRLLAYFEQNEEFFLVQEFIEGHTLSKELKSGQRWSENKVIQMLQDVLPILEFVHSYGVIHRDIKPGNLIRRHKDGRLVLIDFGIVKQIHVSQMMTHQSLNQKTISIGTQGYMPIEQLRGKPRLNSDIYALGIICIQALTGVIPLDLDEDKNGELIWQNLVPVSDELAVILNKMVRYHFLDRYQSVTEVLQVLQSLTNGALVSPENVMTTEANPQVFLPQTKQNNVILPLNLDLIPPTEVTKRLQPIFPHKASFSSTLVTRGANPQIFREKTEQNNFIDHTNVELIPPTEVTKKLQPILDHVAIFPSTLVTGAVTPKLAPDEKKKDNLIIPVSSLVLSGDLEAISAPIFLPLKKSLLLIGAGIISGFITLFTGYTYINQIKAQKLLEEIEGLKATQKYQECLQQAQAFPQNNSRLHTEAQTLWRDCHDGQAEVQITQARELAKESRFKDAIILASQIPDHSNFYLEAQKLISEWSEQIFQIASNKYQQGNLQKAVAIASAIPTNNPSAKKAQTSIQQWNEEWKQNQLNLQVAQKAIDERRWQDAINTANKVNNNAYWQKQSELIIQKAQAEIVKIQQANASRRTYKPRSQSIASSSSSYSRSKSTSRSSSNYSRSKSARRSRPNYSRSKSAHRSRSNYYRSKSARRPRRNSSRRKSIRSLRSYSIRSRSIRIKSRPSSASPRSNNWNCLNNPNAKCRK